MREVKPNSIALKFQDQIRSDISESNYVINIVGFLCNSDPAAKKYAEYTQSGCASVGINFELKVITPNDIEKEILKANMDTSVHGIFIYYPIFNVQKDNAIKDLVSPKKDIEGLTKYWIEKLYANDRVDQNGGKAILPCTPLAVVKILSEIQFNVKDKKIVIFNRSEVVGRPLAKMLAHDGADLISFDEYGPLVFQNDREEKTSVDRREALSCADLIITGVPSKNFPKIEEFEIGDNVVGINFSTYQNFSTGSIEKLSTFVPRVGPLTVAMCMRNTLRLYKNYSLKG